MFPFRVFKFTSSFTTIISFILDFYSSIGLLYSKIPTDENQMNRSFSSVGKMLNFEDNSSYQIIPYISTAQHIYVSTARYMGLFAKTPIKLWHFWVVNRRVRKCHLLKGEKFDYCKGAEISFWWYNILGKYR